MLSTIPIPAIIAHRGYSALAPENTLQAFNLAILHNADAIELDVKLSKDGHMVVIHDQTVDRTTNKHGKVNSFTLQELSEMDAGTHFDIEYKEAKFPTLDEVLKIFGQKTLINIELTNYSKPLNDLPNKVAQLVLSNKLTNKIMISSFNPIAIIRIHRIIPNINLGLLALPGMKGLWARSIFGSLVPYDSLNIEFNDVSKGLIKWIHLESKKLFVYTVNKVEDIHRMSRLGVDGIITDDPPMVKQILQGN